MQCSFGPFSLYPFAFVIRDVEDLNWRFQSISAWRLIFFYQFLVFSSFLLRILFCFSTLPFQLIQRTRSQNPRIKCSIRSRMQWNSSWERHQRQSLVITGASQLTKRYNEPFGNQFFHSNVCSSLLNCSPPSHRASCASPSPSTSLPLNHVSFLLLLLYFTQTLVHYSSSIDVFSLANCVTTLN